jgi:hypothetical protein
MRRRIYWLLPDLASARRTMNDLLLARIDESHIHFAAREDTDMTGLHPANILQTSDVVRAAQLGLVVGAASGAVAGVLAVLFFSMSGDAPHWGVAAILAIVGAPIGAWVASMIGVQLLLMVDVPRSRLSEIEQMLATTHPEGHFEGEEPNIPAFP